jgi:hypothetical protein
VGFEPTKVLPLPDFETGALGHYATSPYYLIFQTSQPVILSVSKESTRLTVVRMSKDGEGGI